MFSEALGRRVELSSCRLDGDHNCQFTAVGAVKPVPGTSVDPTATTLVDRLSTDSNVTDSVQSISAAAVKSTATAPVDRG